MTEILVDYTQFKTPELANQLFNLVLRNEKLLEVRHFIGVIARHGAILSEHSVAKGQKNHEPGIAEFYAVINPAGNVVGAASVLHNLPLSRLRLPISPFLARGPLSQSYKYASPNISAWTDANEGELLTSVFTKLATDNDQPRIDNERHKTPWVIEPTRSPQHIHDAIALSGLTQVATHRFYDGESRKIIPKVSTLYAKSSPYWPTSSGQLKELRTGKWKSIWDIDEILNETKPVIQKD